MRLSSRWQSVLAHVGIFVSYLAAFAVVCLPWLLVADRAVPLASPIARADTRLILWILWWVAHSLGTNPFGIVDAPINHPAAAQLTGSEHFATFQLIFAPVYLATDNLVLAANAVLFLAYPLGAFAMNRLLAALGFEARIAWVVGFLFALGSLQVAAGVHNLHVVAFFPAAVAWSLHRLREAPTAGRGAAFGVLLVAAFLASYYTAAIVLVVVAVWTAAEALRPAPQTRRFVAITSGAIVAGLLVLGATSIPYLARPEVAHPTEDLDESVVVLSALHGYALHSAPGHFLGYLAIALALASVVVRLPERERWLQRLGLVLFVAGAFLAGGGLRLLFDAAEALPFATFLSAPIRFFRMSIRFAAVAGFGLTILAAIGLRSIDRRLPRTAAWLFLAAVVVGTWAERGSRITFEPLDTIAAAGEDADTYSLVGRLTARRGPGPLLELPFRSADGLNLQAEAMIGATRHGLPLVAGHTGYFPRHRTLIDALVARLPKPEALQDIVDMTRLRWILVRPARDWSVPQQRKRLLWGLEAVSGVGPIVPLSGGWRLVAVHSPVQHPEWFDVIQAGSTADRSVLGTPLRALEPAKTASRLKLDLLEPAPPGPLQVHRGEEKPLGFRVENLGRDPWPVADTEPDLLPWAVKLDARWHSLDRPEEEPRDAGRVSLLRDVPGGESVRATTIVHVPSEPGRYLLEVGLEQAGARSFEGPSNPVLLVPVEVHASPPPQTAAAASTAPGQRDVASGGATARTR